MRFFAKSWLFWDKIDENQLPILCRRRNFPRAAKDEFLNSQYLPTWHFLWVLFYFQSLNAAFFPQICQVGHLMIKKSIKWLKQALFFSIVFLRWMLLISRRDLCSLTVRKFAARFYKTPVYRKYNKSCVVITIISRLFAVIITSLTHLLLLVHKWRGVI